jgi:hypothetical protein
VLAHLHHTPRVRPHHHGWVRDAVIAAQLGAAALVVVTALEDRHSSGSSAEASGAAVTTELVAEGTPPTAVPPSGGDQPADHPAVAGPTAIGATAAAATGATSSTAASPPGRIEISVVRADTTTVGVDAPSSVVLGPLSVSVLDGSGAVTATTTVELGQVGRLEGLAAGTYRLVLSSETPVTEPSPDVGISAASSEITGAIELTDGDVLLVAAQPAPPAGG